MRAKGVQKLNTDQIIARYKQRSGFRLADYAEVGLPIYTLNVQALTLAHKRLPPIEEFILRCLAFNISSTEEMKRFLGLEEEVIKFGLINLAQTESIALTASRGTQAWVLTSKGRTTLSAAELVSPEQRSFPIHFDALTRKPTLYRFQKPLKHKDLTNDGLKEIEQIPPRRPQPNEISPLGIEKILKTMPGISDQRRDVLAIRSLENIKKAYIRALALFFRSNDGNETQMAFVIDGKLSQDHEMAFAGSEGFRRLIEVSTLDPQEKQELESAKAGAQGWTPPAELAERLQVSTEKAEVQLAMAAQELEAAEGEKERQELQARLLAAEDEVIQLRQESKRLEVRNLYVADHRPLLEDALKNAKFRLMIVSPWIRAKVVDADFIFNLERLLSNGVSVYIGYGIKERPTENAPVQDEAAVIRLTEMSAKFPNLSFKRLGNTHAKVLIKDRDFAAITSFNWLSFAGDPNRTFRDEQGILLRRPELVEQKFSELEPRFRVPAGPAANSS